MEPCEFTVACNVATDDFNSSFIKVISEQSVLENVSIFESSLSYMSRFIPSSALVNVPRLSGASWSSQLSSPLGKLLYGVGCSSKVGAPLRPASVGFLLGRVLEISFLSPILAIYQVTRVLLMSLRILMSSLQTSR